MHVSEDEGDSVSEDDDDDDVSVTASVEAAGPSKPKTTGEGTKKTPIKRKGVSTIPVETVEISDECSGGDVDDAGKLHTQSPNKSTKQAITTVQRSRSSIRKQSCDVSLMRVMQKVYEKELMENVTSEAEQLDEISVFCQYVDRQLRAMPDNMHRITLQNQIQNAIYSYQMSLMKPAESTSNMWQYGVPSTSTQYQYTAPQPTPRKQYNDTQIQPNTSAGHQGAETASTDSSPTSPEKRKSSGSKRHYTQLQNVSVIRTRNQTRMRPKGVLSPIGSSSDDMVEVAFENM